MKSEGCDEGDVFGQKWYGIGRVLSSSVSLRRRQTTRITFMSNNIPIAQEAQSVVATVGLTGKYLAGMNKKTKFRYSNAAYSQTNWLQTSNLSLSNPTRLFSDPCDRRASICQSELCRGTYTSYRRDGTAPPPLDFEKEFTLGV
ncbi:hypothetical protein ARMGADRAFT_1088710 [Armillaria gallica]|uniref:Uncharacterized protein n=1 Tax=Armillaria gallica TaxID=47427 RepID=A0A2H3D4N3_ARMGA|nr:hypothetical protein ARMGADRAFT_1088710 [Armillaria gallica]